MASPIYRNRNMLQQLAIKRKELFIKARDTQDFDEVQSFDHDLKNLELALLDGDIYKARYETLHECIRILIEKNMAVMQEGGFGFTAMKTFVQDFKDAMKMLRETDKEFLNDRHRQNGGDDPTVSSLPSGQPTRPV